MNRSISKTNGGGTKRRSHRPRRKPSPLWTMSVYSALVSFEQPYIETLPNGAKDFGWETVECSVPVETYDADTVKSKAIQKVAEHLTSRFPWYSLDEHVIEVKRVTELSQIVFAKRNGQAELFAFV